MGKMDLLQFEPKHRNFEAKHNKFLYFSIKFRKFGWKNIIINIKFNAA